MKYTVNMAVNKTSKDGSILSKVAEFQQELSQHEAAGLNSMKKHPHVSACDRECLIYNRHTKKTEKVVVFGSNSYLGATIFPEELRKQLKLQKNLALGPVVYHCLLALQSITRNWRK